MSQRVNLSCEVKRERSRSESESDKGDKYGGLDPKPGDLSMSRLKQGESLVEARTSIG